MPVCPDCGSIMKYDHRRSMYVCKNCGFSLTREEWSRIKSSKFKGRDEEEKEDKAREYLAWWLSRKK